MRRKLARNILLGSALSLTLISFANYPTHRDPALPRSSASMARNQAPSEEAARVIQFIISHPEIHDIGIVLDKPNAAIYVIDHGKIVGISSFLHGAAHIDDFPGGSMAAAYTLPIPLAEKKVTPAGRFKLWKTLRDPDYGTSLTFAQYKDYRLAIHRVYRGTPSEQRPRRLLSPSALDNAISYGCVNVTDEFYDSILDRLQLTQNSYVYILPWQRDQLTRYLPMLRER